MTTPARRDRFVTATLISSAGLYWCIWGWLCEIAAGWNAVLAGAGVGLLVGLVLGHTAVEQTRWARVISNQRHRLLRTLGSYALAILASVTVVVTVVLLANRTIATSETFSSSDLMVLSKHVTCGRSRHPWWVRVGHPLGVSQVAVSRAGYTSVGTGRSPDDLRMMRGGLGIIYFDGTILQPSPGRLLWQQVTGKTDTIQAEVASVSDDLGQSPRPDPVDKCWSDATARSSPG